MSQDEREQLHRSMIVMEIIDKFAQSTVIFFIYGETGNKYMN
jgi:hypothetical protein